VKRIVADPAKCLACRTCEIACALAHVDVDDLAEAIRAGSPKPRIYIEMAGSLAVPLQCRHCDDAPCVRVCPSGALARRGSDAPVLGDQEKCIGCAFCVEACPFGVIQLGRKILEADGARDGQMVIVKCDLCQARQAAGQEPACVASCPVNALRFVEVDQSAKSMRAKAAAAVVGSQG
jgi:carbon-monoxide dehydrogenase iron sulfur subunit